MPDDDIFPIIDWFVHTSSFIKTSWFFASLLSGIACLKTKLFKLTVTQKSRKPKAYVTYSHSRWASQHTEQTSFDLPTQMNPGTLFAETAGE